MLILLAAIPRNTLAQQVSGIGDEKLQAMEKRWEKFRSDITITTRSGEIVRGQVMAVSDNEIVIYPGTDIPLGESISDSFIRVSFSDIAASTLDSGGPPGAGLISGGLVGGGGGFLVGAIIAGGWSIVPPIVLGGGLAAGGGWLGNKIQKGIETSEAEFDVNEEMQSSDEGNIERSAFFRDDIKLTDDPGLMVENSAKFRRVFPHKHLRISFATSIGPNSVKKELVSMFESTVLPAMNEFRHGPIAFEFYDVAYRFNYHYIAGAQIMFNVDSYAYIWYDDYNSPNGIDYWYDLYNFEARFYFEYVASPVDRFFTKRHELITGAGLIIASPNTNFTYGYVPDTMTGNTEFIENRISSSLLGLQLRSAVHFYPWPGFSLFGGIEANFIQGMEFAAQSLPAPVVGEFIEIPVYKLNFSTFRVKAGASIWF